MASFTRGNTSRCTQPVSRPTVRRVVPTAGVRSGTFAKSDRHVTVGASDSIARMTGDER